MSSLDFIPWTVTEMYDSSGAMFYLDWSILQIPSVCMLMRVSLLHSVVYI
jgi:hypothetical protein